VTRPWREYEAVSAFYGTKKAKRSEVPLMAHIDEGLAILDAIGATERAKRAYCIHPLVQDDADLARSYAAGLSLISEDATVLALAFEYRNIANATLSMRSIKSEDDITLSPLDEVNDMLRADKVQNWKDFAEHHRETHARGAELEQYFRRWHARLGLSEQLVANLVKVAGGE